MNSHPSWRKIFGRTSNRLKDEELILRFFALYYESERYERPMSEFLSKFSRRHREPTIEQVKDFTEVFTSTVDAICNSVGQHAFRPERAFNAAVFDAVMVGLAIRLSNEKPYVPADLKQAYDSLLALPAFRTASSSATSFETNVSDRIKLASEAFSSI